MARILIVEDSPTQAEQLRAVLEAKGFAVEAARDATEALDRFGRSAFDLVISDVVMPGLSGYDLCRRIKSGRLGKTTPVMLLTSLTDPMDIIQGLESGADAFLTKPYEPDHLIHRARSILESRNLRAGEKARMGIEISFLGKKFTVTSEKEQILDLLISTFEDIVRTNRDLRRSQEELSLAKSRLEDYSRRLEGKVEATEERYRRLVETAADAILIADAESGMIIDANEAASRLWGRPAGQLIGMSQRDLHPETPEGYYEKLFREAVSEGGSIPREAIIRRADGTAVPVEISSSVFEVQGRRLIHGIFRDLTARKAMDARLHQVQRMEAMGRLTGGLAHDFNNLLTIILGNLQMLEKGIKDDTRQSKRLQAAQQAALRGADLTRRLLAFGRGQTLEPRVVNVNALVEGMENMLHRTLGEDVEIVAVLARNLVPARLDPHQLENALLNLCINARDAMPSGGKLTIETANGYLDEAYAARHVEVGAGPYVMVAVTDTGIGMAPEVAERAFEPFFTTKETGQGTGLGLSQVYGFVKQSGGHAKIYSEPGHGTTVKLYFPIADAAEAQPVPAEAQPMAVGGSEYILVVEDDADVRDVLVSALSELGYRVVVAGNGPHALEVLEEGGRVDLLLTDVVMPGGFTGPELAKRACERHPAMRVLYMSGYTKNAMLRDGKLGTETELLLKPFDKETLARKVRHVLDK